MRFELLDCLALGYFLADTHYRDEITGFFSVETFIAAYSAISSSTTITDGRFAQFPRLATHRLTSSLLPNSKPDGVWLKMHCHRAYDLRYP